MTKVDIQNLFIEINNVSVHQDVYIYIRDIMESVRFKSVTGMSLRAREDVIIAMRCIALIVHNRTYLEPEDVEVIQLVLRHRVLLTNEQDDILELIKRVIPPI